MAVSAHDTRVGPEAPDAGQRPANTRSSILDVGERLVQVRGFNGFSYADVAAELSVTKASLHYHFPSKAELGEALIARYAERSRTRLQPSTQTSRSRPPSSTPTRTCIPKCCAKNGCALAACSPPSTRLSQAQSATPWSRSSMTPRHGSR